MPRGFDRERTNVHKHQYHFIWCPKYRKSVLEGEVRDRLEELIEENDHEPGDDQSDSPAELGVRSTPRHTRRLSLRVNILLGPLERYPFDGVVPERTLASYSVEGTFEGSADNRSRSCGASKSISGPMGVISP